MGDKGFPALMRAAKRFKPRGKGHEVRPPLPSSSLSPGITYRKKEWVGWG